MAGLQNGRIGDPEIPHSCHPAIHFTNHRSERIV
jgi:hypothetical protein